MLFNEDLFEILSEVFIGLTIPTALTDTELYRYISDPASTKYNVDSMTMEKFLCLTCNDDVVYDNLKLSKELKDWHDGLVELHYLNTGAGICIHFRLVSTFRLTDYL